MTTRYAGMLVLAWGAAASPLIAQSDMSFIGAHGAQVPSTYLGTGDNDGLHLDLWPDQAFHLVGDGMAIAGRWSADPERGAIVLDLGGETFPVEVRNAERLRPLDAADDGSSDLVSAKTLDPAELSLPLTGMFTYLADAPTLVHCATGHLHPVMQEGDYLALERAYLENRPGPGEPLFVTLDATLSVREQMEGAERLSVTVDTFGDVWPGDDCALGNRKLALTDAVWRIVALDGQEFEWSGARQEPFLSFRAGTGRMNASVGCNVIGAGFDIGPEGSLAFPPLMSTQMACPSPLDIWEARLISTLSATSGYEIGGQTLRLLAEDGSVAGTLRAVYLP